MSKNEYSTRVYINHEEENIPIFKLGFLRDGGYFVSDMADNEGFEYVAKKTNIPGGDERIKRGENKEFFSIKTPISPKISHHIDGNAHISGEGIVSGFSEGKPKGLGIQSFPLIEENDGGPIFVFQVQIDSLKHFKKKYKKRKNGIILDERCTHDMRGDPDNKYEYVIEGYYILKRHIPNGVNFTKGALKRIHPTYGIINLKVVHTPPNCPGVIAITCIKDCAFPSSEYLIGFSVAPGARNTDGSWDIISVAMFPKNVMIEHKTLNRSHDN